MKSKNAAISLTWIALTACATGNEVTATVQADDVASIEAVVTRLEEAWTAGNGEAWGREFTEDADFTVWFGPRVKGREAIAQGHKRIFDDIYRNTRVEMEVAGIRFLTPDIALVDIDGWVTNASETRAARDAEVHPLIVMARSDSGWKVEAFQNTPNFGPTRVVNGDIRAQPEFTGQ